jgi:uncharacterized protein (TIGR03085 family)
MGAYPTGVTDEPLDATERAELCDLFAVTGPDAPTLCEGWATLDLAAHLVVREHDPRAGLAILGRGRFDRLERRLMDGARAQGYERLVERLRGGPPALPWRLPGLRTLLNTTEWFVHHEDVRRANGRKPRHRPDIDAVLWPLLRRTAPMMLRRVKGAGVALSAPGHGEVGAHGHGPSARVQGTPQELVLFLYGRRTAAHVEITGPDEALAALDAADLGV